MTESLDTAVIRAEVDTATPGPWELGQKSPYTGRVAIHQAAEARKVNPLGWQRACICREARPQDAAFIVHARTNTLTLCDEVDRLRAELAQNTDTIATLRIIIEDRRKWNLSDQEAIKRADAEIIQLRAELARLRRVYAIFEEMAPPDLPRDMFARGCFAAWEGMDAKNHRIEQLEAALQAAIERRYPAQSVAPGTLDC